MHRGPRPHAQRETEWGAAQRWEGGREGHPPGKQQEGGPSAWLIRIWRSRAPAQGRHTSTLPCRAQTLLCPDAPHTCTTRGTEPAPVGALSPLPQSRGGRKGTSSPSPSVTVGAQTAPNPRPAPSTPRYPHLFPHTERGPRARMGLPGDTPAPIVGTLALRCLIHVQASEEGQCVPAGAVCHQQGPHLLREGRRLSGGQLALNSEGPPTSPSPPPGVADFFQLPWLRCPAAALGPRGGPASFAGGSWDLAVHTGPGG